MSFTGRVLWTKAHWYKKFSKGDRCCADKPRSEGFKNSKFSEKYLEDDLAFNIKDK